MAGPEGRAIGVDMTPAMLERARESAGAMGLENVELHTTLIEALPVEDESVDVVISNGVIDLVPDKEAVFDEIDRVLRPGGRLQFADAMLPHFEHLRQPRPATPDRCQARSGACGVLSARRATPMMCVFGGSSGGIRNAKRSHRTISKPASSISLSVSRAR
jgi:ubiquinone/menaquinone biosynthesis C-methylase UbiE